MSGRVDPGDGPRAMGVPNPARRPDLTPGAAGRQALVVSLSSEKPAYRKTMVDGLPVFTTWPVGVSFPVTWSTRKQTMASLSWFAA